MNEKEKANVRKAVTLLMRKRAKHSDCDGQGCPACESTGIDPWFLRYGINGQHVEIVVRVDRTT